MDRPTDGGRATQQAAAVHLNMSVTRLKQLIADGSLPRDGTLDEYREAYIRRLREHKGGTGPNEDRARFDRARAELTELQVAEKRGELILRQDWIEISSARVVACKNAIRAIPKRLVVLVPGFSRAAAAASLQLIDEALDELSLGDPALDGAPARKRRKGVGRGDARVAATGSDAAE